MLLMLAFSLSIHCQNCNWKNQTKPNQNETHPKLGRDCLVMDKIGNNLFSSENSLKNYSFCSQLDGCGKLFGGGKH